MKNFVKVFLSVLSWLIWASSGLLLIGEFANLIFNFIALDYDISYGIINIIFNFISIIIFIIFSIIFLINAISKNKNSKKASYSIFCNLIVIIDLLALIMFEVVRYIALFIEFLSHDIILDFIPASSQQMLFAVMLLGIVSLSKVSMTRKSDNKNIYIQAFVSTLFKIAFYLLRYVSMLITIESAGNYAIVYTLFVCIFLAIVALYFVFKAIYERMNSNNEAKSLETYEFVKKYDDGQYYYGKQFIRKQKVTAGNIITRVLFSMGSLILIGSSLLILALGCTLNSITFNQDNTFLVIVFPIIITIIAVKLTNMIPYHVEAIIDMIFDNHKKNYYYTISIAKMLILLGWVFVLFPSYVLCNQITSSNMPKFISIILYVMMIIIAIALGIIGAIFKDKYEDNPSITNPYASYFNKSNKKLIIANIILISLFSLNVLLINIIGVFYESLSLLFIAFSIVSILSIVTFVVIITISLLLNLKFKGNEYIYVKKLQLFNEEEK